ncbi:MAG TPA: hypothetical protein VF817_02160 [Patescibacteria group bacterium]
MHVTRQDVIKTVLIIWFLAATGYVIWDQYQGFKIRGMQASYQQGYGDAINQVIDQAKKEGCQPFEVRSNETKVQVVSGQCLQQANQLQQQALQPQAPQKK